MSNELYKRTKVPKSKIFRLILGTLLFFFVFGIFIGFFITGNVSDAGVIIGIDISIEAFIGLVVLGIHSWNSWRKVPQHIQDEWRYGKLVDCTNVPAIKPPLTITDKTFSLGFTEDTLEISKDIIIKVDKISLPSTTTKNKTNLIIKWSAILEIEVCNDSDSYDYYKINMKHGGSVTVTRINRRRPPEHFILDAFRSIGQVPIRLLRY